MKRLIATLITLAVALMAYALTGQNKPYALRKGEAYVH